MALRFLPLRLPTPRTPRTFRAAQSAPRGCLPSAATLRLPQVPPSQPSGTSRPARRWPVISTPLAAHVAGALGASAAGSRTGSSRRTSLRAASARSGSCALYVEVKDRMGRSGPREHRAPSGPRSDQHLRRPDRHGAVRSLAAAYGQHAHLGPTAPRSPRAGSYRRNAQARGQILLAGGRRSCGCHASS